jgi:predicted esterase
MLRPYSLPLVASFILVVLLLPACGDSADDSVGTTLASTTTTTTVVEEQVIAVTEKDLVYATWEEATLAEEATLVLDMSAPVESSGAPIVIHLPGLGGHGTSRQMVEGLVEEGAIVFVVQFALVRRISPATILPDPSDHGANIRAMAESVACAIRFARAQASQLGSDDPVVVLTGFSGGGGPAAHTALFGATLEASWDEYAAEGGPPRQVECEVTDGSTHVDALVGMAGIYDAFVPIYDGKWGRAYQQERDPEQWSFLSSSIGANPDLKVRLLHGESDGDIPYENSVEFAAMLTDAGYDVGEVIAFDGGHWVPTELVIPTVMELIGP